MMRPDARTPTCSRDWRYAMTRAATVLVLAVASCAREPAPERWTPDVEQLERSVVPIIDALDVEYYLDEGASCHAIRYARGEFRDGDRSCVSASETYGRFDAPVHRDFDRISAALKSSGVNSRRFQASVNDNGTIAHVAFRIVDRSIEWNWFYLYDPTNAVPKDGSAPDAPRYQRINARWWLVREVDD